MRAILRQGITNLDSYGSAIYARSAYILVVFVLLQASFVYAQTTMYADTLLGVSDEWDISTYPCTKNFSGCNILGAPDVYPLCNDDSTGQWTFICDQSREWIEVGYSNHLYVDTVRIYETNFSGTIDTVYLRNVQTGTWNVIYAATASLIFSCDILEIAIPTTSYIVDAVRLAIGGNLSMCYPSFDAIALTGSSCDITASFNSYSDSSGYVYFTNTTSVADTGWVWVFGDGEYSYEENPVHYFATDGPHEVFFETSSADFVCDDFLISTVYSYTTPSTPSYQFDNGGLYGGTSADLAYSATGSRLFSGIETPASLFFTDDNATTWYHAFNKDSLEYANETRGWSGKAERILSNQNGWMAVQTNHPKGKYSSVVISFNNGDTNTWKTAVDPYLLNSWGYSSDVVGAIGLSDYFLHAAMGPYLVKIDTGTMNPSTDVDNVITTIGNLPSSSTINSIAVANNAKGYPYYIAVDENGTVNGYNRLLFKFDGNNYSQITLPSALSGIRSIFTHPAQLTGDTIFITGMDVNTQAYKIFKSYDAGANWVDISYLAATNFLSDVDYSANWNLSASNNAILIIPGNAVSKDLGASWESMSNTLYQANAIHPADVNTVVGSSKAVEISTSGVTGSFVKTPNYGLEALAVNKIARTASETTFYIATKTGLGYTSAYLDTSLSAGEKWASPYGQFPVITDTIDFGSVVIDPADSLHVIAGCKYGFYTTTSGITGFSLAAPTNFTSNNPQVKDIVILNSSVAIAVTGGDSLYDSGKGNIWRTTDGGLSWTVVSPSGFESGNTIAMGSISGNTVVYVGTGLLNVDTGYLWKSSDMGLTWLRIQNGPSSMSDTSIMGLPINDIAVDPRGTDTLYIAAGYANEYAFIVSKDGGNNFSYLNAYAEKPYTSIAINNEQPDTVYTAAGREIYLYDLVNNNFYFVFRGLPDEQIPDLMTGSILVGTTTGFYTFDPVLEKDTDIVTYNLSIIENNFMVNVFPNPFTGDATISLSLQENNHVSIELYDLSGRKVSSIYNGNCNKGNSRFNIDGENLASGSYLLSIKIQDSASRQLLYHIK